MNRIAIPIPLLLAALAACTPRPVVAPAPAPMPAPAPAEPAQPPRVAPVGTLTGAAPGEVGMEAGLPARLDSLANAAIANHAASGIAIAVGRWGRLVHLRGYGAIDWAPGSPPVTDSTLFDMASVTKVVATTTLAAMLEEQGRLDLDQRVSWYLPGLSDTTKQRITLRQILTHRGGFEAFAPLYREFRGREQYLAQIGARPLKYAPGTATVYSDWDLVLAGLVVERVAGQPLDRLAAERIFAPLGMRDTRFRPDPALRPRIAMTEVDSARGHIWGEVHDPNAWALGGVAGHAGLFSSARDMAIFAQMLLNGGEYGGARILRASTVARWTAAEFARSSRALGWDTPSPNSSAGRFFSPRSFGHTGYTGTSIWVDPERGLFVVILTNRVDPTSENNRHVALRRAVADAVQGAIVDAPLVDWEARAR
ncbi:serine hydrolase domain-containing protein [Longimicrobium sp.]|uniref:serine hydrolase domain-containing protein n=1 Tax=Longimicrobium sp. TaxID=2029185 RepID=UPI002BDAFF5A|nr:serine hydrolase domain-containing protein [Longimicrobium sp.]HSU17024.1 serine hydrolase domain-containing protein [Longimicrobium sp.]